MNDKVRNGIYIGLFLLNAGLTAAVSANAVPPHYLGLVATASVVVAGMMKQFGTVS